MNMRYAAAGAVLALTIGLVGCSGGGAAIAGPAADCEALEAWVDEVAEAVDVDFTTEEGARVVAKRVAELAKDPVLEGFPEVKDAVGQVVNGMNTALSSGDSSKVDAANVEFEYALNDACD